MRKPKGQTVDLLYTNKEESNKKKKKVGTSIGNSQKNKKNKTKKMQNDGNEKINLDNEIIIGLTPKKDESSNKKNSKKNKRKNKPNSKSTKKEKNKKKTKKGKNNTQTPKNKKKSTKKRATLKIVKWTSILAIIAVAIVLFMMSSVFNINQIVVLNNNKISSQEIINLSGIQIGTNMFKTTNKMIKKGLKINPYIEDVKIKRSINGVMTLEVEERTPTYMLKFANAYVYINNQGYMLEITETPLELPIITGFATPTEEIKEGNRLVVEDLKKLEDVIRIIESAKNNSLGNMITQIDISDSTNYILTIESEAKTVQFGDISNVNIKLLKIEALIQQEKGVSGEIYFQDTNRTVFREEVKR